MAYTPVPDPAPPLTPEQKRKNAAALAKQEAEKKKAAKSEPINPEFTQEPSKPFAKGGSVGSASKRADGCASKGKTKGRMY